MRRKRTPIWWTTLTAAAVMMTAAGCASHQTQDEHKQAAKDRWNKTRADVMYAQAKQQLSVGDLDKAEKTCNEAIQTSPEQAEYHELAARILMERGELERSYRKIEQALEVDGERSQSHYLKGVILQRWQRYGSALESYERAYELSPDRVTGLLAAVEMLVKLERTDEAVERIESKQAYFENSAAIRISLGRIHLLERRPKDAVRAFREASLLSPEDPTILEHLALAEQAAGEFVEATYHLTKLLEREDYADRDDLRETLGDCFMAADKTSDAHAVFIDLTRRDPENVDAWVKLAQVSWLIGDRHRVNAALRQVLSLSPKRHEGYLIRGLVERQAGRLDAALAQFEHAAGLAPSNALPWIMKGMTLEQAGDRGGAIEAYERALEINPEDPRPRRLLAGLTGNGL